ncbi:MAG: hypothetical protein EBS29_11430 [Chloroflexia bacterium]|nr:hypothetical protein [Chloroflexia bacterium]
MRVGLWTSPHLHSYRERIQINGELISQTDLIAAVNQIIPFVSALELNAGLPATFAIGFAIAMRYFADNSVDLVVVEVGLGGRFDSANVLTPLLSVVTSISYDHMELLGDTIDAIAMQKGGIAKPRVPMLIAPQPYAALVTVTACAAEAGAPCVVVDDAGTGGIRGYDPADERVRGPIPELFDPYDVYHGPHESALKGEVQIDNTRLAVAAALFLRKQRINIGDDAIATGLRQVVWRYRLRGCRCCLMGPQCRFGAAFGGVGAVRLPWASDYVGVGLFARQRCVSHGASIFPNSRPSDCDGLASPAGHARFGYITHAGACQSAAHTGGRYR